LSQEKNNIILIGFMGAGKSVVGRLLANKLDRIFIDTDQLIESREGASITQIFETCGEEYFRKAESEAAESLLEYSQGSFVAATGGGIMLRESNRSVLKKAGKVILLQVSAEEAFKRVGASGDRPLLNDPRPLEKIRNLLEVRKNCYAEHDYSFNTDGKTPQEICEEICLTLKC